MRTKDIFCANEQLVTTHDASVDSNGEFVFTCQTCGRFVKLPADLEPAQMEELLAKHEEANTGQVSIEASEKTLDALLGSNPVSVTDEATLEAETTPETPTTDEVPAEVTTSDEVETPAEDASQDAAPQE